VNVAGIPSVSMRVRQLTPPSLLTKQGAQGIHQP
jgi:hypothetical protein